MREIDATREKCLSDHSRSARPVLLIVDDEAHILAAMRRTLRKEGYEILTAGTPNEALATAQGRAVDLVLCDQMMPGMRGKELLTRIAEIRPHAARILMTGWADAVTADELEALGISGPFAKPWEDAALKETLRKAVAVVIRDPG